MTETYKLTDKTSPHQEDELAVTVPQDAEVVVVTLTEIDRRISMYEKLLDLWKARKTAYSELKK